MYVLIFVFSSSTLSLKFICLFFDQKCKHSVHFLMTNLQLFSIKISNHQLALKLEEKTIYLIVAQATESCFGRKNIICKIMNLHM